MSSPVQARDKGVATFRPDCHRHDAHLATLTALGFTWRNARVTADAERNLRRIFRLTFFAAQARGIASRKRCRSLQRARRQVAIHAAIEDNAIDLLYPSAKDELRDLMEGQEPPPEQGAQSLYATFYRFLDGHKGPS